MTVRYLLDTNICIYIAKHNPITVRKRFEQHQACELAMSAITLGELRFGAEKSQMPQRAMAMIQHLTSVIQVMDVDKETGVHYGQIRAHLQASGQIIGNNDLWLAAHARSSSWVLVTNNVREFDRVPGLKVENWVHEHT